MAFGAPLPLVWGALPWRQAPIAIFVAHGFLLIEARLTTWQDFLNHQPLSVEFGGPLRIRPSTALNLADNEGCNSHNDYQTDY